jgi:hypothetical protein
MKALKVSDGVANHPALVEFAARLNAETVVKQQEEYSAQISALHADYQQQLAAKNEDPRRTGQLTTLWTVIEFGEFRRRCPGCRDLDCSGCQGWQLGEEQPYAGAEFTQEVR